MDNVCRECGKKFHSDLRYCPRCGGDAVPPRTKDWHYRAPGMIAHTDPDEELVEKAYRQNGWILLCMGILLIPVWLFGLYLMIDDLSAGDTDSSLVLLFIAGTIIVTLVFSGAMSAFQARRPSLQILSALLVLVISSAWSLYALVIFIGFFLIALMLWASRGRSRHTSNPSFLSVMSALAIISALVAYLWGFRSTMGL